MKYVNRFLCSLYSIFGIAIIGAVISALFSTVFSTLGNAGESGESGQSIGNIIYLAIIILNIIILFVFAIQNLLRALKLLGEQDEDNLLKSALRIKLGSIGFFVVNFIVLFVFAFVATVVTRGLGILLVPVFVVLTYLVFLGTTSYSLCLLILMKRKRIISTGSFIFQGVLQLTFVLDIVSTLVLSNKIKRVNRSDQKIELAGNDGF